MSEYKHTPGPWGIEEGAPCLVWLIDSDGRYVRPIAEARRTTANWDRGSFRSGEPEANALLISKAPEMVEKGEALERAEAHYRRMHDLHGDGSLKAGVAWDDMRRAGNEYRALLSSLKGGRDE